MCVKLSPITGTRQHGNRKQQNKLHTSSVSDADQNLLLDKTSP